MIPTRSLSTLAACVALAACSSAPYTPRYASNGAYASSMLPSDVTVLSTSPALIETTPIIVERRAAKAPADTKQSTTTQPQPAAPNPTAARTEQSSKSEASGTR